MGDIEQQLDVGIESLLEWAVKYSHSGNETCMFCVGEADRDEMAARKREDGGTEDAKLAIAILNQREPIWEDHPYAPGTSGCSTCGNPIEDHQYAVIETKDELKMAIVFRHDLSMRLGKKLAQSGHAAMMVLIPFLLGGEKPDSDIILWLVRGMTKICVRVNSEEELMGIAQKAEQANLRVNVVTDAGHTEFHGVPTRTCLAIGPNLASEIDKITGHLKLL